MFPVLYDEHGGKLLQMNHSLADLDRQHHYRSVFLRDLDLSSPDHMFWFLFVHQIHMAHCSLTNHSMLKNLKDLLTRAIVYSP